VSGGDKSAKRESLVLIPQSKSEILPTPLKGNVINLSKINLTLWFLNCFFDKTSVETDFGWLYLGASSNHRRYIFQILPPQAGEASSPNAKTEGVNFTFFSVVAYCTFYAPQAGAGPYFARSGKVSKALFFGPSWRAAVAVNFSATPLL